MPRIAVYVGEGIGHLNMAHLADIVWSLDVLEFRYDRIDREALLGGALDQLDVLIVPGGDGQEMIEGLSPDNPWHKEPWEPPVPVGQGMGSEGVALVKQFVTNGGKYLGIGMGGGWFAAKDLSGLMDVTTASSPLGSGIVYLGLQNADHLLLAGYAGVTCRDGKAQAGVEGLDRPGDGLLSAHGLDFRRDLRRVDHATVDRRELGRTAIPIAVRRQLLPLVQRAGALEGQGAAGCDR